VNDQTPVIQAWTLPPEWRPPVPLFAFHEDTNANAVLITPAGRIYAVAEERLTRRRFQGGFPRAALRWLEEASGLRHNKQALLVFGNRTHLLPRLLGRAFPSFEHNLFGLPHKLMLAYHDRCCRSPRFAGAMEAVSRLLLRLRWGRPAAIVDHHFAHAASAYFTSGWDDACAVTVDNYGDGFAAKVFSCRKATIEFRRGVSAKNSPGQFYGEVAQLAGIHPLLAGKLTGMAASGRPTALTEMQNLFALTPDKCGFSSTFGWRRSSQRAPFAALRDVPAADLASSAQQQFEDALVAFVDHAAAETGHRRVALAGGCFANVRVNQRIAELPHVDAVWIHPAMSDQGIAFGAALAYLAARQNVRPFRLEHLFLGPEDTTERMRAALDEFRLTYTQPADMAAEAAALLHDGKILARFDGPLEYGLRALGNRSVLYRPQDPQLQSMLNAKLRRAAYMPFAPVVLEPYASLCFDRVCPSLEAARFMTISLNATAWMKQHCPGVVHLDGTVRPQILRAADNPPLYCLLERYHRLSGLPCLVNTSFNLHEEPIVATARDACRAFVVAELDYLILGPFLARRA